MPIPVLMPALSPTMEEGTLARWLKREGDDVTSGDVIAEIETDKATMEVEAIDEGVLGRIVVDEGTEGVKVNATIAIILEDGEDASAIDEGAIGKKDAPAPASSGQNGASAFSSEGGPASKEQSEGEAAHAPLTDQRNAPQHTGKPEDRIKASPLARRLAQQQGLALDAIKGTGPHGRIVKRDVEEAAAAPRAAQPAAGADASSPAAPAAQVDERLYPPSSYDTVKNDGMRKTIARRLHQSFNQEVPHFPLVVDIELDSLLDTRKRINAASPPKDEPGAYKLSVNDFILKASASALMAVPDANASYTDDAILRHYHADIGVAVAIDGGLITPIV
ncbi:MAG: 2-oxo acid dehydrogenase subunit E2, partial [Pseudomonadota bacterium]